jgi:hypothetical protein
VDDFEDGSLEAWQAGGANPNPPSNSLTGGPAGLDDRFLSLASTGSPGAGGRLVAFNTSQWAGNYLLAGVTAIQMAVRNPGVTDLVLRLILQGSAGQSVATVTPVSLPAGSDWAEVSFALASANLNGAARETVLGGVTTLNLVHSPGVVLDRTAAPSIAGRLGVDNVMAVPEPRAFLLLAVGLGALVLRAAGRQARVRAGPCRSAPSEGP